MAVEDPGSIDASFHMPFIFPSNDPDRTADAVLIAGAVLTAEVTNERKKTEEASFARNENTQNDNWKNVKKMSKMRQIGRAERSQKVVDVFNSMDKKLLVYRMFF